MEYVKLDDEWKETISKKDLSGNGFDLVMITMKNGDSLAAELINGKKLQISEKIKLEKVDDINVV